MQLSKHFDKENSPSRSPVPLTEMSRCKWPLDTPKGILFCNDNTCQPLASYCLHHARLAYTPRTRKA